MSAPGEAARRGAQVRQQRFLETLRQNPDWQVKEICEHIGVSPRAYQHWRQREERFAKAVHEIRTAHREGVAQGGHWDGTFEDFRLRYFGMETYWLQSRMVRAIQNAPEGSISLICLPVGSGKTTTLEQFCAFLLATDPNHRILYLSETQPEARKRVSRVQSFLTDGELYGDLIARFGPFKSDDRRQREGKPWSADFFTVDKRDSGERDWSMSALGMTSQIYGIRADTIVLDDVQTMKSLNKTDDYMDKFRQEILSRRPQGGVKGRIVVIMTRIGPGDFAERLMEEGLVTDRQLVILPVVDADGKSNCPELYPDDRIPLLREQVGEKAWWNAYMQKPHLGPNATFTEEMLEQAKDPMRRVGEVKEGERVVLGVDPALEGNTGLVSLAYDRSQMSVVDAQRLERPSSQEVILDHIAEFAGRYRPDTVVVETMAYQGALSRDDRLKNLSVRYGFQIREHKTYGQKLDPTFGVAGMQRSFLMRELWLPDADTLARGRLEPLIEELRTWRPDIKAKYLTQDLVMALWFSWLHANEFRARPPGASAAEAFRFRGMKKPTQYSRPTVDA